MALHEPTRVGEGSRERIDLSVIVPILNEAPTLEELADRLMCILHRLGKSYEVIFVDDGSTDDSAKLLKRLYDAPSHHQSHSFQPQLWPTYGHLRGP